MINIAAVDGTPSQIPAFFTFDRYLGVTVTRNFAQCPLNHVTFVPAKFEVAPPNCLGNAFRYDLEGHIKCCSVPSTSCDLCSSEVCNCHVYQFRRIRIYNKKKTTTIFDIDIGVKVTQNVGLYFLHHVTYAHAKFEVVASKFRRRCIYKKHIFDIDPNLKVK